MKTNQPWIPHDWQRHDALAVVSALGDTRRVLYVAPQGAGKTTVATLVAAGFGRVLWLTPTRETAIQAATTLRAFGVPRCFVLADAPCGENDANANDVDANVYVGTVASARLRDLPERVDLVVVDEAHHAPARTWIEIVARYDDARVLGLTGSPWRLDGRPLREHFDILVEGPKPSVLVARGELSRPTVYTWPKVLDLPTDDGADYGATTLELAASRILVGDVFETWQRRARGWQTVMFASTVAHSRSLAEDFCARGVAAEHVDSTMGARTRDAVLARFKSGVTTVLSTVGVLAEGWDMPEARCMISARPMRSLTLWLQQCGRVMRSGPRRIVLDHAGNALRLRHPAVDRDWSLDGHASEASRGQALLVPCPECNAAIHSGCLTCPECGHEFDEREQFSLTRLAGELVPLATMSDRQLWTHYVERARWKGEYIYVAEQSFRRATGRMPDQAWYPESKLGFGDLDILLCNARWLGRPRSDAYAELKTLRAEGRFLPQPRVRMPQGRASVRRLAMVPDSVSLADAPSAARVMIKKALLGSLEKHEWNISKACKEVGLEYDAVHTYCSEEYRTASENKLVARAIERQEAAIAAVAGIAHETMAQAARRHHMSADTMRRRLVQAGVVNNEARAMYVLDPATVDAAIARLGSARSHTGRRARLDRVSEGKWYKPILAVMRSGGSVREWRAKDLYAATGCGKSIHKVLNRMVGWGMIERTERHTYHLPGDAVAQTTVIAGAKS